MQDAAASASVPRCPACGGDLPIARYQTTIKCTYCSAQHPNPVCLAIESEVLVRSTFGYELTRVTSCKGPSAIGLADRQGLVNFDDLIPVVRVTGPLEKNVEVFRLGDIAWVRTWTASALQNGRVMVKNDDPSFQDSFFDKQSSLDDLRLDARPAKQQRRNVFEAFGANLRDAPFETIVSVITQGVTYGIKAAFVLFFFLIAAVITIVMLQARW